MEKVEALIEGGKATASAPLGPALGPLGVNIGEIVNKINEKTEEFKGMQVPVTVEVDEESKKFEISVGKPPVSALLRKEADLDKLSSRPNEEKIANVKIEQLIKIAKLKKDEMNAVKMKNIIKQIAGTCLVGGILIEEKDPREFIREIDEGKYEEEIKKEKTELTQEELEELEKEKEEMMEKIEESREKERETANEIVAKMENEGRLKAEIKSKLKEEGISVEVIKEVVPETGVETEE